MTPRKVKVKQKTIARLGPHGKTVRVFRFGDRVTVQSRTAGITKSYRGPDAEAKALGFANRLLAGGVEPNAPRRATVAELWEAYTRSSDYRELRARSAEYYREAWALFAAVVPILTPADDVTVATLEEVRTALETTPRPRAVNGLAINTVRKAISIVKGVWAWGERTEYLHRNRIHAFKFKVGKDRRPAVPDEYSQDEFTQLLGAMSFDKPNQRTAFCVLALCGYQGVRINAIVHLRWEDVRWADDALVWQSRWDKMGNEWDQPMRAPTRAVLARLWESLERPSHGWVFPARRQGSASQTYTPQSFWAALKAAEARVGIPHRLNRGAHGFRRMVAGDVADKTGSALEAMHAIGDTDINQAKRYVKRRMGKVARSLNQLDEGAA